MRYKIKRNIMSFLLLLIFNGKNLLDVKLCHTLSTISTKKNLLEIKLHKNTHSIRSKLRSACLRNVRRTSKINVQFQSARKLFNLQENN